MQPVFLSPGLTILVLAILMDIVMGEPPAALHPVVWMGKIITYLTNRSFGHKRIFGLVIVILMGVLSLLSGVAVLMVASFLPEPVALLLAAYFLKSTFSFRMLLTSADHIRSQLESDTFEDAKRDLKALVSRDTTELDQIHLTSAVIESTAENFVDGIVSPLLFYLVLGLPGALAYKAVNTLDSMIGYRNKDFLELGWASARLDDLLNWFPARLSPLYLVLAALFAGSPVNTIKTCIRDHALPASPNSGWPMAAASGSLGVKLEKQGHYTLGGEFREPGPDDIKRSSILVGMATVFLYLSLFAAVHSMKILIW